MEIAIFIIVGFIQLGIAVMGTKYLRENFSLYFLLVVIVSYGLAYDNYVIASGAWLTEGAGLKALNAPRFWIHALFTPTMIIAAFGALRKSDVGWTQGRGAHIAVCSLATLMVLLGSYIDVLNLTLEPAIEDGSTRYVNGFEFIQGPPIPAVVTIIVVLVFGIFLWRKSKWPWLFVGALLMFVTAPMLSLPVVQNIGEIAFAAGMVSTMAYTHKTAAAD